MTVPHGFSEQPVKYSNGSAIAPKSTAPTEKHSDHHPGLLRLLICVGGIYASL